MASVTFVFNQDVPTNIPLEMLLPDHSLVPLPPGVPITAALFNAAADGSTDNTVSQLGTVAVGSDGTSVDIFPTAPGQLGYALLQTRVKFSDDTTISGGLLLLFVDQGGLTLIYDVVDIHRD